MELFKPCFILVSLTLSMFPAKSLADDFTTAFEKIQAVKTKINYKKFCSERSEGTEKIACRIKKVPSIGFLVCRMTQYCLEQVSVEVDNLEKLKKDGIKTVKIAPQPDMRIITGVMCTNELKAECSGYLVEWIDSKTGKFEYVRNRIDKNEIPELIKNVRKIAEGPTAVKKSCSDLTTILDYMQKGETKYRQICDLQGFFLVKGGFLVTDVAEVREKMGPKNRCWEEEPTTEEVLTALMTICDELKKKVKKEKRGVTHSSLGRSFNIRTH